MVDFKYLYLGLCGMAQAHRAGGLAGHLGAAVLAGYFFGENHPDLDPRVVSAIEEQLDRIIRGDESIWFNPKKAGITVPELFEPLPKQKAEPERIGSIAEALKKNIPYLRESGHNVIFASIALRALRDHPNYATPAVVDGIVRLIQKFDRGVPGRGYFGKDRGWIGGRQALKTAKDDVPPYRSQTEMATTVIGDLIDHAAEHRRGFGGLFHVINHAAALVELDQYGYGDVARRGWDVHRRHLRLWRSLPDLSDELGRLRPADHDPRTPQYWTVHKPSPWSARLTHRVKTLYGFFTLLRLIEDDDTRKRAEKQFLYLMA